MTTSKSFSFHGYALISITVVLSVLSFYLNYFDELFLFRLARGFITLIFILYLVSFHKNKTSTLLSLLSLFLILYMCANFFAVWFEISLFPNLMVAFMIIAALALILYILPKLKDARKTTNFKIVIAIIVLVNLVLLLGLVNAILENFDDDVFHFEMLIGTSLVGVISCLSLLFNYHRSSSASLSFSAFWFTLVFSEVFRAIGYYNIAYEDFSV